MIVDSIWNLVVGMLGIFAVMGILYFSLKVLNRFSPGEDQGESD